MIYCLGDKSYPCLVGIGLKHAIYYMHFHLKTKVEDSIGKRTLIKNTASTDTILAQISTKAGTLK